MRWPRTWPPKPRCSDPDIASVQPLRHLGVTTAWWSRCRRSDRPRRWSVAQNSLNLRHFPVARDLAQVVRALLSVRLRRPSQHVRSHEERIRNRNRQIRTGARAVQAPRARAHGRGAPLRGIRPGGRPRGRRQRVDHAHSRGPRRQNPRSCPAKRHRHRERPDRRCASQPCRGCESRGAGSARPGRAPDEGEPAHRRAARCGDCARNRPAHRASPQPRVHHGRSDLSQGPDDH